MNPISEQLINHAKNNVDTQLAFIGTVAGTWADGLENLAELSIECAKAALEENADAGSRLASPLGMDEAVPWSAIHFSNRIEHLMEYSKSFSNIVKRAHHEFSHEMAQHAEQSRALRNAWFDEVAHNLPAGSENLVLAARTALENMDRGYEQLRRASEKMVSFADTQGTVVNGQVNQILRHAVSK